MVFIEYRGSITDEFVRNLHKTTAPSKTIITLRKLKTLLPSLKSGIDKSLSSNLVYKFECSRCKKACYCGMTERHFKTRVSDHMTKNTDDSKSPIRPHTLECYGGEPLLQDFKILRKVVHPSIVYLSVLEAFYIREQKPSLNTRASLKDEY